MNSQVCFFSVFAYVKAGHLKVSVPGKIIQILWLLSRPHIYNNVAALNIVMLGFLNSYEIHNLKTSVATEMLVVFCHSRPQILP
jgi:hypothetical protein